VFSYNLRLTLTAQQEIPKILIFLLEKYIVVVVFEEQEKVHSEANISITVALIE